MHPTLRNGLLSAALVATMLVPGTSPAQQGSDPAGEAVEPVAPDAGTFVAPPPGIEAIEVTGESLDATNVQNEAQAITAFDTGELDRLQIGNVDRLALNVPGLHVGQQGQNAIITLRGVGTENSSITGEPGVAFHVDGIYYGSPAAARTAFFDIQSIEVKRGPQGLLGGKNSTSGAIWVTTNDPTSDYEVRADYTTGNYARQRGRGVVNVPVGESLSARVALFYETRDGYLERQRVVPSFGPNNVPKVVTPGMKTILDLSDSNDAFDLDNFGLRGKLRFQPTDTLDFVVGYDWFKEGGNGPQADIVPLAARPCETGLGGPTPPGSTTRIGVIGGCRLVNRSSNPFLSDFAFYPATEDLDPRKTYADFGSSQDDRYWGWNGKAQWEAPEIPLLGPSTVRLQSAFRENELNFNWDFDGSDQEIFNLFANTLVREYTTELQWSGGDRLAWQGTLFFQRQTGDNRLMSPGGEQVPDPNVTKFPNTTNFATYQNTINFDTDQWTKNKSYGAALHGAYSLSDSLTFSLGGRWNKDHKRTYLGQRRSIEGIVFEACRPKASGDDYRPKQVPLDLPNPRPGDLSEPLPRNCGLTFRGTNWGSRLEWKPGDDYLIYAGIDRGYKSGGFASGGIGNYSPEKIWAYTLGTKTEFFDQRLQLNLEGFVYNYSALQLTLLDATKIRTENTDARMYGWEVEMRAQPIEGLRLQGLVAYLYTEAQEYFSLDPATLGEQPNQARVTTRDRRERRGLSYPGGEVCQTPHSKPVNGVPTFFPRKLCRQFGEKNGLDDYSGNKLSRSPELKWNISAEYEVPLGRFGTLIPAFQYAWQDDAYYRVFNTDFDLQESFHETNASVTWRSPEQMWEVRAFVNNIEDAAIKQNILISPATFGSIPLAWYGEPRFWGMQVSFKY